MQPMWKFDLKFSHLSKLLIDFRDTFDQSLALFSPHLSEQFLEQIQKLGVLIVLQCWSKIAKSLVSSVA